MAYLFNNLGCDQQTERNKSLDNLKKTKHSTHEGQVSYKWPNLSKSPTWIFTEIKGIHLPKNTQNSFEEVAANLLSGSFPLWFSLHTCDPFPPATAEPTSNGRHWPWIASPHRNSPTETLDVFFVPSIKLCFFPNVACFFPHNMFGPKNIFAFLLVKHGNLLKDVFVLLSGTCGNKHITGSHQRKLP